MAIANGELRNIHRTNNQKATPPNGIWNILPMANEDARNIQKLAVGPLRLVRGDQEATE
jgi:hypothetical protein